MHKRKCWENDKEACNGSDEDLFRSKATMNGGEEGDLDSAAGKTQGTQYHPDLLRR